MGYGADGQTSTHEGVDHVLQRWAVVTDAELLAGRASMQLCMAPFADDVAMGALENVLGRELHTYWTHGCTLCHVPRSCPLCEFGAGAIIGVVFPLGPKTGGATYLRGTDNDYNDDDYDDSDNDNDEFASELEDDMGASVRHSSASVMIPSSLQLLSSPTYFSWQLPHYTTCNPCTPSCDSNTCRCLVCTHGRRMHPKFCSVPTTATVGRF